MRVKTLAFVLLVSSSCTKVWGTETAAAAIKVDQAGYLPDENKVALVTATNVSDGSFLVRRAKDESVAFRGRLTPAVADKDSGDNVAAADFSVLKETGTFSVDVPGVGTSWKFAISRDAYARVFYLALRSYYGQRCGSAVDLGPEFPGLKHDACHLTGAYDASSGKQGAHVSTHGWHDAGDYGRYVVNSGISTGTLLWTYELYRDRVSKVNLHIPESGSGTPDILNEIRWNLEWMLTMQDTDGGVWHKQTSTHFCGFIMPETDTLTSEVIGTGAEPFKGTCATADLAAVMAIAARAYKPYDQAFAKRVLEAAEKAWAWVEAHPDVPFRNPPGVTTGDYGDSHCDDEHFWAASELLRTTGKKTYADYFNVHYTQYLGQIRPVGPPSWSNVAALGLWTYALAGATDPAVADAIRKQSVEAATEIAHRTVSDPYRVSLVTSDYIWGSNGVAANYSMQLLVADRLQHNDAFRQAALDNLHYLLGRNTFSLSWVTQVGAHAFQHPHHRPSAADGVDPPWPGLMSGGPNPGRQDNVMKRMVSADTLPAKAYVDETGAYACNEVAINWNAPLVFLLAALLPQ